MSNPELSEHSQRRYGCFQTPAEHVEPMDCISWSQGVATNISWISLVTAVLVLTPSTISIPTSGANTGGRCPIFEKRVHIEELTEELDATASELEHSAQELRVKAQEIESSAKELRDAKA